MLVFLGLALVCGFLFTRLPGSFLPEEDQGYALAIVQLPPGATLERTKTVFEQVRTTLEAQDGYEDMMQVAGAGGERQWGDAPDERERSHQDRRSEEHTSELQS